MLMGHGTIVAMFLPGDDAYQGAFRAIIICLLDYIVAFTVLGLGGIFRCRIQKPGLSLMCGALVALGLRYLTHILSGYILFASYAEWFFTQEGFPAWGAMLVETLSPATLGIVYSVVYNGFYMIPELICTAIVAILLARVPKIVTKIS
jgi:thiamine transporter